MEQAFTSLAAQQRIMILQSQGLAAADIQATMANEGYTASIVTNEMAKLASSSASVKLASAQATETLVSKGLTKEKAEQLLIDAGLITSDKLQEGAVIELTYAKVQEILANESLSESNKKLILNSMGVTTANNTQALSYDVLATKIYKAIAATVKFLITTPIGLAMLGAAALIGAAKLYNNITISVEEATDALDEFNSTFEKQRKEYKEHEELVDKVSESYDNLAKKVNTDTNFNLGLNDDEYEEFVNLNNELAEAFPTLVKGYDDSGNAIIDFGNDCSSTTEKLRELLELEKQVANIEIAKNLPEYFKNTKTVIEDYDEQIAQHENNLNNLNNLKKALGLLDYGNNELFESKFNFNNLGEDNFADLNHLFSTSIEEFKKSLDGSELEQIEDAGVDLSKLLQNDGENVWFNAIDLPSDLKSRLQTIIHENSVSLTDEVNDEWLDAQNALKSSRESKESSWNNFTDNLVSTMHTKSGYQSLTEAGQQLANTLVRSLDSSVAEEMDENDPYAYVRDNVLSIFKGVSDGDISEINKKVSNYTNLDMSEMTITGQEEARESLKEAIRSLLPEDKAEQLIVTLGLDVKTPTQEAYDSLKTDLDAKYGKGYDWYLNKKFDELGINTEDEIKHFHKLYAETGDLTKAFDEYAKAIEKSNKALAESKPSFSEQLSGIRYLSEGLDQLDSIMADIIDEEQFDYSSIINNEDFEKAFGEYKEEYEDFIKTVSESPTDIDKCKDAFDNLATAYVYGSKALSHLTEESKDAAIIDLEQMGVENAEEVVTNMLSGYTEAMQLAKAAGIDFANATAQDIYDLQGLEAEFAIAGDAAFNYYLRKKLVTDGSINTAADCNALIALAEQCQVTGKNLELLIKLRNLYNIVDSDIWGDATKDLAQKEISKLSAELMSLSVATVRYNGGAKTLAARQEKAKDATDKLKEALEKEKEALEELKSEYDELYDAIQWFYDKQIDKIDEKIDKIQKENEALEKQQENMDMIIAAIESNYDAEIKLIQDKIDALQDSNDEEERALALEEAKRKLQEAKSRKTLMVYSKGVGFTYQVDTKAIKEAEDELEELQENEVVAELEKQIEKLEEAKEKWSEIPDAYNKAMQEIAASNYFGSDWKNITLNASDELLSSFEGKYTGIQSSIAKNEERIESYEKEKEKIEELKQAWEDAKNAYQYSQYEAQLASFFGSDYEYQLLHNSATWRRKFADEYSDICSQIEALEERIKAANEETASSTESSASRVSEAAGKVKESAKDIKFEINNDHLDLAKRRLEALNEKVDSGKLGVQGFRDAVDDFVQHYEAANGCTEITNELKDSVANLKEQYAGTGGEMEEMVNKITSDISVFESKSKTMSENLSEVDESMKSITESETAIETNVEGQLTNVEQTIANLKINLGELKDALVELEGYKAQIESLADTAAIDLQGKVAEIQEAISVLNRSVNLLYTELGYFVDAVSKLDATNITLLTTAFGGAGGEGTSTGLLGAVQSVVKAIDGGGEEGTGLVQKLAFINNQSNIQALIDAFGITENGSNLLSAIQIVSNKIYTDGDDTCLYATINKLTETITNIDSVKDSFVKLQNVVINCKTFVEQLKTAIEDLPSEKIIKIKIEQEGSLPKGIGTAHTFGTGTANNVQSGNAYASGTWGLKHDEPNSLVGELGTEIVVRDGQYFTVDSPTVMDLEKDDIVFNHKQTEEILKNGKKSVIDKLSKQGKSVYSKITGNAFAEGTMQHRIFDALINGLQSQISPVMVMPDYKQALQHMPNYNDNQSVSINIGDIHVHGVENANGLSQEIVNRLPNILMQKLNKK